ncbi:hypothetical protein [Bauldia sp.]|uniref:hypothetical protein n=1 Tax=Bauldia sp. TaxID=2575872 RepID=UPI003BADB6A1
MSMNNDDRQLIRPGPLRVFGIVFVVILAALVGFEFLIVEREGKFGIDGTLGFYAWFGFLSSIAIVVVARVLGVVLGRRDTYYDT